MNTSWSSPDTNVFKAAIKLRKALSSGYNARLVKARNEDCQHPIKEKKQDNDFRNYEFSIGYPTTKDGILAETHRSDFEKHLSLNYKTCYGTPEAVEKYYTTGVLSADNFKGVGRSHLVQIDDMISYLKSVGDTDRAKMFEDQYRGNEANNKHFWDFYRYKHGSPWAIKSFKRKLWVVETLDKNEPRAKQPLWMNIINILLLPLYFIMKYTPKKSVMKMKEYKNITYRIGGVTNGFKIEFQIPYKFGF